MFSTCSSENYLLTQPAVTVLTKEINMKQFQETMDTGGLKIY